LCAPHLVAHEHHGHTRREHRNGQEILHLPISGLGARDSGDVVD
jgi:hypothetical protein